MIKVVLGLGFGDEGKGLVVDYLCSKSSKPLVVRFSGGHQVGHTVVRNGIRHVFSNFGSGTLSGSSTFWSGYCTVDPVGLINELQVLNSKGVQPVLYISESCPITTPYDIYYNRLNAVKNSCGVGFGSTLEREESHYSLKFIDLFYPDILRAKVDAIASYYEYSVSNEQILNFLGCCDNLVHCKNIFKGGECPKIDYSTQDCIYEGSQGLLLDQNYGIFPNVTRSNTGCSNISELLDDNDYELFLVTRAYQTRHGNGFMTNENIPHNILENPLETNKENEYQGKFRRTLLDVSLLEYAINKDNYIRDHDKRMLVITCLDHIVNEYRFTYKGEIVYCSDENDFVSRIFRILNINKGLISRTDESKNILMY